MAESVDAVVVVGGKNSGNTQRLLEIAQGKGKAAFHVETEADLDNALAGAHQVGITAGASTPNWVLRRVFRSIQALPFRKGKGWRRGWFSLERTLLLTSAYLALGAGATCYASARLQGIPDYFPHILIAVLYVQSMHILNHLIGRKADRYNEPDRAAFYDDHKVPLSLLAVLAGGAGLMTAYTLGGLPFLVLLAMSLTGLSYNLNLVPAWIGKGKYRRIRDIPGSKTVLIALAWGIVTSAFPALTPSRDFTAGSGAAFLWASGLVFTRTAFFDILDMQGDRIVGRETLPILLGEKRTLNLLKGMLAALMALLGVSAAFGIVTSLGYLLLLPAGSLFIVLLTHEKGHMLPGMRLEFLVDTHFIMGGLLTVVWALATG
jgi:4-hydroxy-3-methylbut-2-enyl diphosphate reductase